MNKLFIIIVLLLLISGCDDNRLMTVPINNIKDTSFIFPNESKNSTMLEISINGYSNDSVIVNNIKLPGGKHDTLLKTDWYNDSIIINLQKFKATKGNLILKCKTY